MTLSKLLFISLFLLFTNKSVQAQGNSPSEEIWFEPLKGQASPLFREERWLLWNELAAFFAMPEHGGYRSLDMQTIRAEWNEAREHRLPHGQVCEATAPTERIVSMRHPHALRVEILIQCDRDSADAGTSSSNCTLHASVDKPFADPQQVDGTAGLSVAYYKARVPRNATVPELREAVVRLQTPPVDPSAMGGLGLFGDLADSSQRRYRVLSFDSVRTSGPIDSTQLKPTLLQLSQNEAEFASCGGSLHQAVVMAFDGNGAITRCEVESAGAQHESCLCNALRGRLNLGPRDGGLRRLAFRFHLRVSPTGSSSRNPWNTYLWGHQSTDPWALLNEGSHDLNAMREGVGACMQRFRQPEAEWLFPVETTVDAEGRVMRANLGCPNTFAPELCSCIQSAVQSQRTFCPLSGAATLRSHLEISHQDGFRRSRLPEALRSRIHYLGIQLSNPHDWHLSFPGEGPIFFVTNDRVHTAEGVEIASVSSGSLRVTNAGLLGTELSRGPEMRWVADHRIQASRLFAWMSLLGSTTAETAPSRAIHLAVQQAPSAEEPNGSIHFVPIQIPSLRSVPLLGDRSSGTEPDFGSQTILLHAPNDLRGAGGDSCRATNYEELRSCVRRTQAETVVVGIPSRSTATVADLLIVLEAAAAANRPATLGFLP